MKKTAIFFLLVIQVFLIETSLNAIGMSLPEGKEIIINPSGTEFSTKVIQKAIDDCAASGGGIVRLTTGVYYSGTINFRDNITLQLDEGAYITGSKEYSDYSNDAFFYGRDLKNIRITGKGTIDGVDCRNNKGEEGFRGPHCIKLVSCSQISIEGITIKNSANWAINCRYCSYGIVTNVTILGGHDGLHTRFCNNFKAKGCDFRTGDDSFAGNDNHDFEISDCLINTSCNGFRMGCMNLLVERCRFWGPGEYRHISQNRTNMLSAFVHFSPKDENPKLISGNWTIKEITVENVDNFFVYNFKDGLWQTGQPFSSVTFDKIKANGILKAFYIKGDTLRQFKMLLTNSEFSVRESNEKKTSFEGAGLLSSEFFYVQDFNSLELENVDLSENSPGNNLRADSGNLILIENVSFKNNNSSYPLQLSEIKDQKVLKILLNNNKLKYKP